MKQRPNLMAPDIHANPFPLYAELRKHAPICQVDPGGMWAISRYHDVMNVLKDTKRFSSVAWTERVSPSWLDNNPLAQSIFVTDPPEHTKLRMLIHHAFSNTGVSHQQLAARATAEKLTERVVTGETVDFISEFAMPMAASVIGNLLGLDSKLYPRFKQWTASILSVSARQHTPEQIAQIRSDFSEMEHYFQELIDKRRREPLEDLMSYLVKAEIDGMALTHDELMSFAFILLPGGLESSCTLLAHTLLVLKDYPEAFHLIHTDLSLIPKLIEEVLRYEGVAHVVFRRAIEEVEIAGTVIPQDAMVVVLLTSANRDESVFRQPDQFILHREDTAHVAFGYGVHQCIGKDMGRMATRCALESLFSRIEGFELDTKNMTRHHSLNARGPISLPVKFVPRVI